MSQLVPYSTIAQLIDEATFQPRKKRHVPTNRRLRLTRGGYSLRFGQGARCQFCTYWTVNIGRVCAHCLNRKETPCN